MNEFRDFFLLLSYFIFTNKSHIMAFHCRKRKCLHTTMVSTGNTDFDNTRLNFFFFFLLAAAFLVLFWSLLFVTHYVKVFKFEISCEINLFQLQAKKLFLANTQRAKIWKKVQFTEAESFATGSSKAKINVFWIFFAKNCSEGAIGMKKIYQKTLILAIHTFFIILFLHF